MRVSSSIALITLAIFLIVATTTSTFVEARVQLKFGPNRQDWIGFIEGIALGIESDFGNVTECTQEAEFAYESLERSFQELQEGFRQKSVGLITAGIIDLGFGIQEIGKDLKTCDIGEILEDIEKIAKELSSGVTGIIEVIVKEAVNIFSHHKDITNDIKNAYSFWGQGKYQLAGVQVGKLLGFLIQHG
jgi:hypothetical protein